MDGPKMDQFWEDSSGGTHSHGHGQHLSYERNLNFSTVAVDDNEYGYPKKKTVRDPLSHRIIEKRRRDRMNNCLADLARLLPPSSLRKGRGRIEKTEIVELAIKHLRHLQCHPCPHSDNCEYNQIPIPRSNSSSHPKSSTTGSSPSSSSSGTSGGTHGGSSSAVGGGNSEEYFRLGYQESLSETMHFLVEREGMYAGDDLCVRLVKHLNKHCETLLRDQFGNKRKLTLGFTNRPGQNFKKGDGSLSSGYQPNGSSGSGSEGNLTNDGDTSTTYGPKTFPLPPLSSANHTGLGAGSSVGGAGEPLLPFDYEGDQNSCSSAQLSIEISDAFSTEGKIPMIKPPIPTIIGSHSSSNNSGSPPVNFSNSDEGNSIKDSSPPSSHRYKFKNKIKQRFEDLQTEISHNLLPHHERRKSLSRQSIGDSNTLRDSDSPDYQPPSPEAGIGAGSDSEKVLPENRPKSVDPNPSQEGVPLSFTKEKPLDTETSEMTNAPSTIDEKMDLTIATSDDLPTPLVDEKPNVELLNMKVPALPIIASLAGLQEAKALAVNGGKTVPAFALHDKGLYYVPLTLDKSLVAPIFAASENNTQPPLHPVTISVCFLIAPDGKPVTGDVPMVPPPPISAPIPLRSASPIPSIPQPPGHAENTRDTHNFIMNRFAQSQVPMMFGGSGYPIQAKGDTSSRYPFSMCGSTGSGSFSSHTNGAGSVGSNSDQQVKLYHHISNNSPESGNSNYYSRSCSSRSGGSGNTGHENSSSRLHSPQTGSGGSSRSRKRSVSISPSVSIGYHSWNEKSHSDDMFMHNPLSSHSGGLIAACPQPVEMNERHGHMRRHSSQQQQQQQQQHHHQQQQQQQPSQQTLHEHYQEAIEASEAAAHRREKRERERDASMYMGSKRSKKSRMEDEVTFSPSSRHTVPSN